MTILNKTNKENILVTGGSGYLASWIIKLLLEDNHRVNATVRSRDEIQKIAHLTQLQSQHPGLLNLYEADLMEPNSFYEAMQDCHIVIHTASPYFHCDDVAAKEKLVDPAVSGTKNIIDSINRTHSVKKLILTSSIAAMFNDAADIAKRQDKVVREQDFNTTASITYNAYAYAKSKAEQLAWNEQKAQSNWEIVVVNPGYMFGPALSSRTDFSSLGMLYQLISGRYREGVANISLGLVDVRDVAMVHLRAALNKSSKGRYITVASTNNLREMALKLNLEKFGIRDFQPKQITPKFKLWLIAPSIGMNRRYILRNVNHPIKFDNQRSQTELDIKYRPLSETLNDHAEQLFRDGILGQLTTNAQGANSPKQPEKI